MQCLCARLALTNTLMQAVPPAVALRLLGNLLVYTSSISTAAYACTLKKTPLQSGFFVLALFVVVFNACATFTNPLSLISSQSACHTTSYSFQHMAALRPYIAITPRSSASYGGNTRQRQARGKIIQGNQPVFLHPPWLRSIIILSIGGLMLVSVNITQ